MNGLTIACGRVLLLSLSFLLFAEIAARIGAGVFGLLRVRETSSLGRFGLGLLLGWAILGVTYLGLGLASVFSPWALVLALLALVSVSSVTLGKRLLLLDVAREMPFSVLPVVACLLGAIMLLPALTLPETRGAAWSFYLGFPWQFLQAGRAVFEHVPALLHIPMTYEMTFSLPIILGDDRLAKLIVLSSFAGGGAIVAADRMKKGNSESAWLGPLLALSSVLVFSSATECKGEMPAAALFVAGAVVQMRGGWALGGLLLGLCVASKLVYGPLVALWCLVFHPPWRKSFWWALMIVAPSVPWWAKNWLALGNPVYPFASGIFPSLNWGAVNNEALWHYAATHAPGAGGSLAQLPLDWFELFRDRHLPIILFLPWLVFFSRQRRVAWVCLAGQFLILGVAKLNHYVLPLVWLSYVLLANEVGRVPDRFKRAVVPLVALYALAAMVFASGVPQGSWRLALKDWQVIQEELFGTFLDVEKDLADLDMGKHSWVIGGARPMRVLAIAETSIYRFPGRIQYNGLAGETPLIWQTVKSAGNVQEVQKRLKQIGTRTILYNLVTSLHPNSASASFRWDDRMLGLWRDFVRRYLEIASAPKRLDHKKGAFCLYRLRNAALRKGPPYLPYLPGIEGEYNEVVRHGAMNDYDRFTKAAERLNARAPNVDAIRDLAGLGHFMARRWKKAHENYLPGVRHGTVGDLNYWRMAQAADSAGDLQLAVRCFYHALELYPEIRAKVEAGQLKRK